MGRAAPALAERMSDYALSWERDLASLGPDGRDLTTLAGSVAGTTFFNTWEWTSCVAAALDPARSLHILVVRRQGELVAWVPLTCGAERLHGLPVRTVRLLGDPLADRVALMIADAEPGLRGVVLDALVAFPEPWDVILLSELIADRTLVDVIGTWAAAHRTPVHWRHCARSPILHLHHRDVAALRAAYPKTLRTRLQRSRKRLTEAGEVRFARWLPDVEQVEPLLEAFKRVEDLSWKGGKGVGIFSGSRAAFFRDLSLAIAPKGWLDVGTLHLDGNLISYRYGFRFGGRYLDYNLAYDPQFARLSPGRILLDEMLASSLEVGLSAVDASHGSIHGGHQLQEWTDAYSDHAQLWILGRTARGRLLSIARNRLRPALHGLRAMTRH